MSKESKEAKEAFKEIMRPVEPTAGAAPGGLAAILSAAKDIGGKVWDAAAPMANHGKAELAAALFTGQGHILNDFHMRGQEGAEKDGGVHGAANETAARPDPQEEQGRGGKEM